VDELVHATGAQRGAHGVRHRRARVDVAHHMALPLRRVRALLQQDDLRLLRDRETRGTQSVSWRSRRDSRRARRVVRCLPSSTPCWGAWGWRRFEGLGRGDLGRRRQRRRGVAAPRVMLEFELSGDGLRRRGPRVLGGLQFDRVCGLRRSLHLCRPFPSSIQRTEVFLAVMPVATTKS
jgi:hypothetical protein